MPSLTSSFGDFVGGGRCCRRHRSRVGTLNGDVQTVADLATALFLKPTHPIPCRRRPTMPHRCLHCPATRAPPRRRQYWIRLCQSQCQCQCQCADTTTRSMELLRPRQTSPTTQGRRTVHRWRRVYCGVPFSIPRTRLPPQRWGTLWAWEW